MLFLTGCGNNLPSEYELGIIDTTEYGNKSKFTFLDNSWNKVGQTKYRYSNMSYCGFFNSFVQDNTLYLLPKGISQKLDCGKVVAFDLSSGQKKEYDFGRTNITDFYMVVPKENLKGCKEDIRIKLNYVYPEKTRHRKVTAKLICKNQITCYMAYIILI